MCVFRTTSAPSCQAAVKKLKGSSQKARRAQILFKADVDGPGWPDAKIAEAFNCRVQTIESVRKTLKKNGMTKRKIEYGVIPPEQDGEFVAECEPNCLTSQCLRGRRIGELTGLQNEIGTWSDQTHAKQRGVDWQFRIDNARTKLKRLYPKIKT